jgi:ADP-ribose pyrophosphatase
MKKTGERIIGKGNWLVLREDTFVSDSGEEVHWECISRTSDTYVVVVVARLMPSGRYVLLRQYRQPIENTVIGFCAGAASAGCDPEIEALRELREETGFVGRMVTSSGSLKVNVEMSNDDQYIFSAEIDETDPATSILSSSWSRARKSRSSYGWRMRFQPSSRASRRRVEPWG